MRWQGGVDAEEERLACEGGHFLDRGRAEPNDKIKDRETLPDQSVHLSIPSHPSSPFIMSLQPSPRGGHHHHHHHHHAHATSPPHGQPPPLIHRPLQYDAQPVQQRRPHHHHHHHHHHRHSHAHAHAHRHHQHSAAGRAPAYDFVPSSASGSGSAGSSSSSGSSSSARSPPNHVNIPALPLQAASSAISLTGKRERSISLSSLGSGSDSDDEDEDAQSFDVNELGQETYEDPARGRDRISIAALAGPASQRNEEHYHHVGRADLSSLPMQRPTSARGPGSSSTTASQPPTQQPRDRPPRIADLFANTASTSRQSFDSLFWERQLWLMEHRGADGLSHCSGSEDEAEHDDSDVDEHDEDEGQEDEEDGVSPPTALVKRSSKRRRRQGNAAASSDVLRTHGAGLPLARVKRVMKGSDPAIKVGATSVALGEQSTNLSIHARSDDLARISLPRLTPLHSLHHRAHQPCSAPRHDTKRGRRRGISTHHRNARGLASRHNRHTRATG